MALKVLALKERKLLLERARMTPELDQWQYLFLMAGCLLITLPLELLMGARVYRQPLRLVQAVLITAILFSIWDIVAIQYDFWSYSLLFTTGVMLPFKYPLEELVFFLVIPICALLTYEAVGRVLTFMRKIVKKGENDA